jgi:hypothetical protein
VHELNQNDVDGDLLPGRHRFLCCGTPPGPGFGIDRLAWYIAVLVTAERSEDFFLTTGRGGGAAPGGLLSPCRRRLSGWGGRKEGSIALSPSDVVESIEE